jgi:hypothetical protein
MQTIELTNDDAAIVFKASGVEVYIPPGAEVYDGGDDPAPAEFVDLAMCMVIMSDTAFAESIRAMIRAHMKAVMTEDD